MDFDLSEEQKMLKNTARDFMGKEIIPIADEYDRKGPLSKEEATQFIKKLIPLGYIVGLLPEAHGGLPLPLLSYGILLEELSYAWASLCTIVHVDGTLLVALPLASEDSEQDYCPLSSLVTSSAASP
jgi:alkylation response protein AidB-like acyl-CoA dehydrogenase